MRVGRLAPVGPPGVSATADDRKFDRERDIPPSAGELRSVGGLSPAGRTEPSPLLSRVFCTTCSGLGATRVVELGALLAQPFLAQPFLDGAATRRVLGVAARTHLAGQRAAMQTSERGGAWPRAIQL